MKRIVSTLVEQEILVLTAANYTLREMHNRIMITFSSDPQVGQTMSFESAVSRDLYFILFVDFLANIREEYLVGKKKISTLDTLLEIVKSPLLGTKKSSRRLRNGLVKLKKWLDFEPVIKKMWFPNIDRKIDLKISRANMIRICGNLNKHDFLKLSQLVSVIQEIFLNNGVRLTREDAIMSLEHFGEWFNENILIYHSSFIAEMLIDIQWSIREYLEPLYKKSLVSYYDERLKLNSYRFDPPKKLGIVKGSFIFHMYWNLMNFVRDKPIFNRVKADKYLKLRY